MTQSHARIIRHPIAIDYRPDTAEPPRQLPVAEHLFSREIAQRSRIGGLLQTDGLSPRNALIRERIMLATCCVEPRDRSDVLRRFR